MPTVRLTITPLRGSIRSHNFSTRGIARKRTAPRLNSLNKRFVRIRLSTRLSDAMMISLSDIETTGSFSFPVLSSSTPTIP